MANTQSAAGKTAQTPPAAKNPQRKPRAAKAKEEHVEGPAGKKLVDNEQAAASKDGVTDEQRAGERRQADRRVLESVAGKDNDRPQETPEQKAEREKREAFLAGVAKLAESVGYNPEEVLKPLTQQPKATRTDRQQKNGITRPASGTTTGAIWDVADELTLKNGRPAGVAEVRAHTKLLHTNEHTIKTQYARWRTFNGVRGRVDAAPAAPTSPEVPENYDEGLKHHDATKH